MIAGLGGQIAEVKMHRNGNAVAGDGSYFCNLTSNL